MPRTFALAFDFGGTQTMAGLVDDAGKVLAFRRFETYIRDTPESHFARCGLL
ncbi:ROK family protein [Gordoniibacillus kamchatkensis]|uniref:ROK family protein n=1 Tax=Gordoniibacillus kamchatkensis TaxID=1590651 RepID=UPI0012E09E00|nr:ROK family protein [Paenibacillus sp. VKM B-2647]